MILCLGLSPALAAVEDQPPSEYQVKAAFLYNFAKFVEWPAEAFPQASSAFHLCIIGADPFRNALEEAVEGRTIGGHPLVIFKSPDGRGLEICHMAFVGAGSTKETQRLVATRRNLLLTVGETDLFLRWGGIINLVRDGNKIRFEINSDAAERVGLKISSKLLALAKVVHDTRDK